MYYLDTPMGKDVPDALGCVTSGMGGGATPWFSCFWFLTTCCFALPVVTRTATIRRQLVAFPFFFFLSS